MMRSMYSGVSGLRAHQLKMDIIGNNIANVNTVGFKGQRVTFQEVYSQTIKGAGSPQNGKGGTNAHQVGLGVSLSSIDTFHIRGAVQRTDNNTDLAVNGDGFFIVSNSGDGLNRSYTRAGNFSLDEDGNLVASNGSKVMGYMVDPKTGVMKSALEGIKISKATADDAKATTSTIFEGNLNNGLKNGVHEPWETTYQYIDALGGKHDIKYTFKYGTVDNTNPLKPITTWNVNIQDLSTGNYLDATGKVPATNPKSAVDIPIKFDENGKLITTSGNISALTLTLAGKNGSADFTPAVDFSKLTQFTGESNAAITGGDVGYAQGFLDTFSIGPTGEVNAVFTNGQNKVIGRIALAVFKNPAGLQKTEENMYQTSPNSGDAIVGLPGDGSMGSINPGTLEMSNVDISREFTEMISTQRGFQANSRIITASDEMLQDLVNLKR